MGCRTSSSAHRGWCRRLHRALGPDHRRRAWRREGWGTSARGCLPVGDEEPPRGQCPEQAGRITPHSAPAPQQNADGKDGETGAQQVQELSTSVFATRTVIRAGAAKTLAVPAEPHRGSRLPTVSGRSGDHNGGNRHHAHMSGEQVVAGGAGKHEESGQNTPSQRSNAAEGRSLTAVHHLTRTPTRLRTYASWCRPSEPRCPQWATRSTLEGHGFGRQPAKPLVCCNITGASLPEPGHPTWG